MGYITNITTVTDVEKQKIINKLREKGIIGKCPMCGNKNFILVDGYFNQPLQSNPSGITLGGRTLPSIAIVCSKCGFISNHALGSLDLLPPAEGDTK